MKPLKYLVDLFPIFIALFIIFLFYVMVLCFTIGFSVKPGNCYNIYTGEVTVCETGEHVGNYPLAIWH